MGYPTIIILSAILGAILFIMSDREEYMIVGFMLGTFFSGCAVVFMAGIMQSNFESADHLEEKIEIVALSDNVSSGDSVFLGRD